VVGYSTLTEFRAAEVARPLAGFHGISCGGGIPGDGAARLSIIPTWGWRPMFIIAGIGSLIVWYLRKNLPESHAGWNRKAAARKPKP